MRITWGMWECDECTHCYRDKRAFLDLLVLPSQSEIVLMTTEHDGKLRNSELYYKRYYTLI